MSKFNNYILEDTDITSIDNIKDIPEKAREVIQSLVEYMIDLKMNVKPLPKIRFIINDKENAKKILGDTGNYDYENKIITIYTKDRLPEDYIRSFCHEMIHHIQNIEGRLENTGTQNVNKDETLEQLESEANRRGTMIFRSWKDQTLERQ